MRKPPSPVWGSLPLLLLANSSGAPALFRLRWFVGQNFLLFICYCKHWAYYIDVDQQAEKENSSNYEKSWVSSVSHHRTADTACPSPLYSWRLKAHAWVLEKTQFHFCHLWCHVLCWPPTASRLLGNRNPQSSTHLPWARTTFFLGPVSARCRRYSAQLKVWGAAPSIGSSAWVDTSDLLEQLLQLVLGSISRANIKKCLL